MLWVSFLVIPITTLAGWYLGEWLGSFMVDPWKSMVHFSCALTGFSAGGWAVILNDTVGEDEDGLPYDED